MASTEPDTASSGSWSFEPIARPGASMSASQTQDNELNRSAVPSSAQAELRSVSFQGETELNRSVPTEVLSAPQGEAELNGSVLNFAPDYEVDLAITFQPMSVDEAPDASVEESSIPTDFSVENRDGQFLSQISLLLNDWFDKENSDANEDAEPLQGLDTREKRRERTYAMLKKAAQDRLESKRLMERLGDATADQSAKLRDELSNLSERRGPRERASGPPSSDGVRRSRQRDRQVSFLPNGMRKEESGDGSFVLKDAVGRVTEVRSHDGSIMSFSYDNRGHLYSFVRSDLAGKIHTTGVKDRHGVIVRDEHGSVRAQGDSITVDANGCVSIHKFDGQFWSLDVLRGIHIERRILEDVSGNWNCLTALLTSDGFRMVTRFQRLQENKRESYRKFGDWLGSTKCSKFRFYGRDGSMIEFENDEDVQALRPSRIWSAGSRRVDREWVGRRQAGTAWEAVHRYISQYLSAL